jgi:hypothetical protein
LHQDSNCLRKKMSSLYSVASLNSRAFASARYSDTAW